MSETLIFSDLHANEKALRDIFPAIKRADLSIFCGDVLGYGTDIDSSIDFIFNHVDLAVAGNHDRLAITDVDLTDQRPAVKKTIAYTRRKLSREQVKLLSTLPTEIWFEDMYITHSVGDQYLRTREELKLLYKNLKPHTKYGFFGHTHEPLLCQFADKIIINPGSISIGRKGFDRGFVLIQDDEIQFVNLGPIL
jgi:putative phosphoesterase